MKDKYRIKVLNKTYNLLLLSGLLVFIGLKIFLKHLEPAKQLATLKIIYFGALFYFIYYKIRLCKDDEFYYECYGCKADPWNELPLNPCNIALIGMLIYLYQPNRYLACFIFFCGLLATPLALIFPPKGFYDAPLFKDVILGFYLTHILCLYIPLFLLSQHLYYPAITDIPIIIIILNAYSLFCYLLNDFLHKKNICTICNYAYNYDPIENNISQKIAQIAPNRFIFSLIMCNLFCLIISALILIFTLIQNPSF